MLKILTPARIFIFLALVLTGLVAYALLSHNPKPGPDRVTEEQRIQDSLLMENAILEERIRLAELDLDAKEEAYQRAIKDLWKYKLKYDSLSQLRNEKVTIARNMDALAIQRYLSERYKRGHQD